MNKQQHPASGKHDTSAHCPRVYQVSKPHSSWEKCDKCFLMLENWRERKVKNKGTNKSSSMIPVYTIHPPIVNVCNKF